MNWWPKLLRRLATQQEGRSASVADRQLQPQVQPEYSAEARPSNRPDREEVETLLAALDDAEVKVRKHAFKLLEMLGDIRAADCVAEASRRELCRKDSSATQKSEEAAYEEAFQCLHKLDAQRSLAILLPVLEEGDIPARARALKLLGECRDPLVVERLLRIAQDNKDPRVRAAALKGIHNAHSWGRGKAPTEELIQLLVRIAQKDDDPGVRATSFQQLGWRTGNLEWGRAWTKGLAAFVEPLVGVVQRDPDAHVRAAAAVSLGPPLRLGPTDPRLVEVLAEAERVEPDKEVKRALAWIRHSFQPRRPTPRFEEGTIPPIPGELAAKLQEPILRLSNPKEEHWYCPANDVSRALGAILNTCALDDARIAMLSILDWYSEETAGAAFLEAYSIDSDATVFHLFDNWMDIQHHLSRTGRPYWKKRYENHPDHDDVERFLTNVWEHSKGRNTDFCDSGPYDVRRLAGQGVSQSGNWCDALTRFIFLYRGARRKALGCMSPELAKAVAYDRESDPCARVRGEA